MQRVVILASVLIATAVGLCEGLKVGAFNIQVFGKTKFGNQEVVKLLSQVRCCDVLVFQGTYSILALIAIHVSFAKA